MPPGFQHPARVAEKVAAVDILSHGRVEWGTGRSTPMEQLAFHVPADDRSRAMWREAVEIVVRMWEQERFSWDSDLLQMPERMQTPKPYQDPHPPCWLAAAGEASAANAGRHGVGLLSFALAATRRSDGQAHPDLPRRASRGQRAAHADQERSRRRVHARALHRRHGRGRRIRPVGLGALVVPAPRRVHADVGAAQPQPRRTRGGVPAAQADASRATSTSSATPTRT